VAQLHAFRAGERKHELMQAMAQQLSDADIAALADYWSARPRGAATGEVPLWRATNIEVPHDFPAAYRVYKTVVETDKSSTRQFYANRTALAAARKGVVLPVGSTIAIVTYPGVIAADLAESRKPAARGFALMSAIAAAGQDVPALLRNADWRYAVFDGQRVRRSSTNEAPCLACHKPRATDSFIFTIADLKQVAGA
jgi:Cytochrome P460